MRNSLNSYFLFLAVYVLFLTAVAVMLIGQSTPPTGFAAKVLEKVAVPKIYPQGATITTSQKIFIITKTPSATIYYTTDGSDPKRSLTKRTYSTSTSLTLQSSATVRAVAVKSGMADSDIAIRRFSVRRKVAISTILPNGGFFDSPQKITITTSTAGADIYYTTDNSDPTVSSTRYVEPFLLSSSAILKAIAIKTGMSDSDIVSAEFTIDKTFSLKSIVINGPESIVTYSKNSGSACAHLTKVSERNPIEYVCTSVSGEEVKEIILSSRIVSGEIYKLCDGNNLNICTNAVTAVIHTPPSQELLMMYLNFPERRGEIGSLLTSEYLLIKQFISTGELSSNKSADFYGSDNIDSNDFLEFYAAFDSQRGSVRYKATYDLDDDKTIGFKDFFLFAEEFGNKVELGKEIELELVYKLEYSSGEGEIPLITACVKYKGNNPNSVMDKAYWIYIEIPKTSYYSIEHSTTTFPRNDDCFYKWGGGPLTEDQITEILQIYPDGKVPYKITFKIGDDYYKEGMVSTVLQKSGWLQVFLSNSCVGEDTDFASLCADDNRGTDYVKKEVVNKCTEERKCEYVCKKDFTKVVENSQYACKANSLRCTFVCRNGIEKTGTRKLMQNGEYGSCSADCSTILKSNYFSNDKDAIDIAKGNLDVRLPSSAYFKERDIKWRIVNVFRMIGYEPSGIPYGTVIGKEKIIDLDSRLYGVEKIIYSQAAKFPLYKSISGPDFKDNIPQEFPAYMFASIFDLFNSGPIKYQSYTNECLLSNILPNMCGALANDKSISCGLLEPPFTIQTPELFGFANRRRTITAEEYPGQSVESTFRYAAVVVHEFVHDLDATLISNFDFFPRKIFCSSNYMDFHKSGSPFYYTQPGDFLYKNKPNSAKDINDAVSLYAAGIENSREDYRDWEDAAESVTAYILTPEYFRERMKNSALLRAKYDYIRDNIFGGIEFENLNLKSISDFEFPDVIGDGISNLQRFSLSDIRPITTSVRQDVIRISDTSSVPQAKRISGGDAEEQSLPIDCFIYNNQPQLCNIEFDEKCKYNYEARKCLEVDEQ